MKKEKEKAQQEDNFLKNIAMYFAFGFFAANVLMFSGQDFYSRAGSVLLNNPSSFNLQKIGIINSQSKSVCKKDFFASSCKTLLSLKNGKKINLISNKKFVDVKNHNLYIYFNSSGKKAYCVKDKESAFCGKLVND